MEYLSKGCDALNHLSSTIAPDSGVTIVTKSERSSFVSETKNLINNLISYSFKIYFRKRDIRRKRRSGLFEQQKVVLKW
ncbi:MAG: hypothetical protein ABIK92_13560 [Pseudomonadota bacterium]